MRLSTVICLIISFGLIIGVTHAAYTVNYLNTTMQLSNNNSARVTEVLTIHVSNASIKQYETSRLAINLTLSDWQKLIGPTLVQHIINPTQGVYNFEFIPSPISNITPSGGLAYISFSYDVKNVTTSNVISPRVFEYMFNQNVFNFEHSVSGEVLSPNSSLTVILPQDSQILNIYPIPDKPVYAMVSSYHNTTTMSWFAQEPLSRFTLTYTITESLQQDVASFFSSVYKTLGFFAYIAIAAVIIALIFYTYIKASKDNEKR